MEARGRRVGRNRPSNSPHRHNNHHPSNKSFQLVEWASLGSNNFSLDYQDCLLRSPCLYLCVVYFSFRQSRFCIDSINSHPKLLNTPKASLTPCPLRPSFTQHSYAVSCCVGADAGAILPACNSQAARHCLSTCPVEKNSVLFLEPRFVCDNRLRSIEMIL